MSLYRIALLEKAGDVLRAAKTIAQDNIFTARNWPITSDKLPAIFIQTPLEQARSTGKAHVSFSCTASLAIIARVGFMNDENGVPIGSSHQELTLHMLTDQIQTALLSSAELMAMVEEVSAFSTEILFESTTAQPIAEARMRMDMVYSLTITPDGVPLKDIMTAIRNDPAYAPFNLDN